MSKIPSNDEIIDELTKDLASDSAENIPEHSCDEATEGDKENNVNETENRALNAFDDDDGESSCGSKKPAIPDDYIDEEVLKEKEAALSEEELNNNHENSIELKNTGNQQFKEALYLESIQTYTEALQICPLKHINDRAILYCNRSASKFKLKWNEAGIDDCSKAIELNPSYQRAYLRRATAFEEIDKLDEALADFKKLLELVPNQKEAGEAVHRLTPLIQARNEKLKDEMMGKLKDLGNMFLKPFGLSTNNFKMQQDPNTGGYSVNFQQ